MDEVRTERLVGTRPLLRDADELHPVWEWPVTLARVRSMMVRDMDHWKRHRFGPWVVRDAATRAVVGRAGLNCSGEEVGVDWLIAAERRNEGLATEIAHAAIRFAFDDVGLDSVVAETTRENAASLAVMARLGFVYERDTERVGLPHVLFRLTK